MFSVCIQPFIIQSTTQSNSPFINSEILIIYISPIIIHTYQTLYIKEPKEKILKKYSTKVTHILCVNTNHACNFCACFSIYYDWDRSIQSINLSQHFFKHKTKGALWCLRTLQRQDYYYYYYYLYYFLVLKCHFLKFQINSFGETVSSGAPIGAPRTGSGWFNISSRFSKQVSVAERVIKKTTTMRLQLAGQLAFKIILHHFDLIQTLVL
eukprot:TRINITY_DN2371_c0_g2_i1.p1 TRINITY_DN2371_c0_g2~~TRINITY_DN2371_c0_g2_i1.p1  ORF type:complete len:210 (-),score=-14.33 TRINITY_DN2371_c0_g2_i1:446-1075(-)